MARKKSAASAPSLFDDRATDRGEIMSPALPSAWLDVLRAEFASSYYGELQNFLVEERRKHSVYPAEEDVFNALFFTPFDQVRVLILGQDPYHDDGQAHGLCFSVHPGTPQPPSLKNIFRELRDDIGCEAPNNGCLAPWAKRGVLLLNAVLTVRARAPGSHRDQGWEHFTDAIIRAVNAKAEPIAFVLWGAHAQKKLALIDTKRHLVIQSAHPSPLSARNGYFGSRPFSRINAFLSERGYKEIDWQLPNK